MDLVTAITGGAKIFGAVKGLFGSDKEETQSSTIDFSALRKSAEKAGFDPAAAFLQGYGSGFTNTTGPAPLASRDALLGNALDGITEVSAALGPSGADEKKAQEIVNQVRADTPNHGFSIPQGPAGQAPTRSAPPVGLTQSPAAPSPVHPSNWPTDFDPSYGLTVGSMGVEGVFTMDENANTSAYIGNRTYEAADGTTLTASGLPLSVYEEEFGDTFGDIEGATRAGQYFEHKWPAGYRAATGSAEIMMGPVSHVLRTLGEVGVPISAYPTLGQRRPASTASSNRTRHEYVPEALRPSYPSSQRSR